MTGGWKLPKLRASKCWSQLVPSIFAILGSEVRQFVLGWVYERFSNLEVDRHEIEKDVGVIIMQFWSILDSISEQELIRIDMFGCVKIDVWLDWVHEKLI